MNANPTTIKEVKQRILESYGNEAVAPGEQEYIARHITRYVRTMNLLPKQKGALLDVGCFPGHLSILASQMGWSVTGLSKIDGTFIQSSFTERMERNGIRLVNVDAEREEFPFADNSFDTVFFNETIEHLPYNPFHALDQIWRVLKPGGTLIFSVPNLASFDHRWALLKGRTIYPLLSQPLETSFHADIAQRHIREYTPNECRYLLSDQDKYLYSFDINNLIMDRSWDGMFYTESGYQVTPRNIRIGTLLREIFTRLFPSCRSNIIVLAAKPSYYAPVGDQNIKVEGFYPSETPHMENSFVRHPVEANWMQRTSSIMIEYPVTKQTVDGLRLLAWLPSPAGVQPQRISVYLNGDHHPVATLTVSPSREPKQYTIHLPAALARRPAPSCIRLRLETTGWKPSDYGIPGDERTLGVMIHLKRLVLIYAQQAN